MNFKETHLSLNLVNNLIPVELVHLKEIDGKLTWPTSLELFSALVCCPTIIKHFGTVCGTIVLFLPLHTWVCNLLMVILLLLTLML